MGKFIDLTGQKFGKLTVIKREKNIRKNDGSIISRWMCKCDCGNETIVYSSFLKNGHTKSCGCLQKKNATKKFTKHNLSKSRIFKTFMSMKRRCYTKSQTAYKYYGARGIKVCAEWLDKDNGFINFYNWAMQNGYTDDLTIDRIDVNGNYEPSNCKWVTMKEQANNRRNNIYIEYRGEKHTISEWSRLVNLSYKTLYGRYSRGCKIEDIFYKGKFKNGPKKMKEAKKGR